jgi:hypothetical protein
MAYEVGVMVIIETTVFTRQLVDQLTEDEYGRFQFFLANTPDAGVLIRGGGGLRRFDGRWKVEESAGECASSTTGRFLTTKCSSCSCTPRTSVGNSRLNNCEG